MRHEILEIWAWIIADFDGDENVLYQNATGHKEPALAPTREILEGLCREERAALVADGVRCKAVKFQRSRES